MDLKNLKLVSVPIELDLGLPYIKDSELAKMVIYDGLPLREKCKRFWTDSDGRGLPYARGLLMIPLSGSTPPFGIPAAGDTADWNHPLAEEAISGLARLFVVPDGVTPPPDAGSPREWALSALSSLGLVEGTVSLVIPLFPPDLALWAEDKTFESFVRKLTPGFIGLYPNSRRVGTGGFIFRRFRSKFFDLSRFTVSPDALKQQRCGIFFAGYSLTIAETPDRDAMIRAQQIPVPFSDTYKNPIAGDAPSNSKMAQARKDPSKRKADMGLAYSLFSCPRARAKDWEVEMPDVWKKLYPRRYADFPGYLHPKAIARMNAAMLFPDPGRGGQSPRPTNSSFLLPKIMRFFTHHYFIAPPMMEAVSLTKFPEDLKPEEVPLPIPAMVVVLPETQKALLGVDGTPLQYLLIGEVSANERESDMLGMLKILDPDTSSEDVRAFLATLPASPDRELAIIGVSSSGSDIFELPVHWDVSQVVTEAGVAKRHANYPDHLAATAYSLTKFALNMLLYFNVVPEHFDKEHVQNTVRPKGPKGPIDYWAPHIYGREFKLPPEPTESPEDTATGGRQGRKPRPHLRWAHWRRQWHGPGMTLLKWVRIDFVWVTPTEDDDPHQQVTQQVPP